MAYNYSEVQEWGMGGIETVPGTLIAPTFSFPFESFTPKNTINEFIPNEHRGIRGKNFSTVRLGIDTTLDMNMVAFHEMGLEQFLYGALGSKTSAIQGAGPAYKHTLTQAGTGVALPTFSLYKNYESPDAGLLPEAYAKCYVDSLGLSVKENDVLKLKVGFQGNPLDIGQTDKTPSYATNPHPLSFPMLTFKWNDYPSAVAQDTRCTSFEFDHKNNFKGKQTSDGNLHPSVRIPTDFNTTGKFSIMFEDRALQKKWLGGTGTATTPQKFAILQNVEINMQGALIASTYYYTLNLFFPRLLIKELDHGGDPDEYSYSWEALYDPTTSKFWNAEVISRLTTIA